MRRALFIGRFQPFHNGHLSAVQQIDKTEDIDEVIIGIAAAQYHHLPNNPYTALQRQEMIKQSLNLKKPYYIIPIPDINNYPKWVDYVKSLTPDFEVIYTGNNIVKDLFMEKGYLVRPVIVNYPTSGTLIRQLITKGKNWQCHVPNGTKKVLSRILKLNQRRQLHVF